MGEAERACMPARAEEYFLAVKMAAARRLAGNAQRQFPPGGVANAVAVHAAAPEWHAVLGVDRPASADAVKRQFRCLSLLVHPDKKRCAVAEGAFKLLLSMAPDRRSLLRHHSTPPMPSAPSTATTYCRRVREVDIPQRPD